MLELSKEYRTKKNSQQFEEEIEAWFNAASSWWDQERQKVSEWNAKVKQSGIKENELYMITIPDPYIPSPDLILEIYNSKLVQKTRTKILELIVEQLKELGDRITKQLTVYQSLCNKFLEEKIEIEPIEKQFPSLPAIQLPDAHKHSFSEDLQLFSSPIAKLEFLQRYVTKYQDEFFHQPGLFNKLSLHLADEVDKEEEEEEEDETVPKPTHNLPPREFWTNVPVLPKFYHNEQK